MMGQNIKKNKRTLFPNAEGQEEQISVSGSHEFRGINDLRGVLG